MPAYLLIALLAKRSYAQRHETGFPGIKNTYFLLIIPIPEGLAGLNATP